MWTARRNTNEFKYSFIGQYMEKSQIFAMQLYHMDAYFENWIREYN